MSQSSRSSAENPKFSIWTLSGEVGLPSVSTETYESLIFSNALQEKVQQWVMGFLTAKDTLQKLRMPWRKGIFAYGPAGCGKSSLSRAVAHLLAWKHVIIPAHEIYDTAGLTRALKEATEQPNVVVCLDNIDLVLRRIDPQSFFDIFDAISERVQGVFWVATTRTPEDVPKGPLVRPGRFDESIRVPHPDSATKTKYYTQFIAPLLQALPDFQALQATHLDQINQNTQLSFAHLEELRMKAAQVLMSGAVEKMAEELNLYIKDLQVSADRWGGLSDTTQQLQEKVQRVDPKVLLSALEVTDAFKRISELVVTAIVEEKQAKG